MKKIMANCGIGFVCAVWKEEFEFEDDVTEEEIEEVVLEWANEKLDIGWQEVE